MPSGLLAGLADAATGPADTLAVPVPLETNAAHLADAPILAQVKALSCCRSSARTRACADDVARPSEHRASVRSRHSLGSAHCGDVERPMLIISQRKRHRGLMALIAFLVLLVGFGFLTAIIDDGPAKPKSPTT